ncbi:MAG: hypothetical protein ACOYK9_02615 [Chlamydiia bacterium]
MSNPADPVNTGRDYHRWIQTISLVAIAASAVICSYKINNIQKDLQETLQQTISKTIDNLFVIDIPKKFYNPMGLSTQFTEAEVQSFCDFSLHR